MQAVSNRTFICSVLFLDIVGYSRKPVAEQIQLKERLNVLLTEALANVAVNDRIILDTGDGAALNFLGDPEDALFVSLAIRDALATPPPSGLTLRFGINLGPVKLIKDINGQPNIIGDGINVAQRVMSFAEPGQILVSRSYHEVVSRLSEDLAKLFHFEGSRTDKHVREHEVYAVQASSRDIMHRPAAARPGGIPSGRVVSVLDRLAVTASIVTGQLRRKPRLSTAIAVAAILAVAVGLRVNRKAPEAAVAASPPPAPVVAVAPTAPVPAAADAPAPVEKPAAVKPKRTAPSTKPVPAAKPKPGDTAAPPAAATAPPAVARAPERAAQAKAEPESRTTAAGGGTLLFTVRPWAEIYVDGKRRGDAPPVYELSISAGKHTVELRHPDFPPYVQSVTVKPDARIEIRHTFLPKEYPNPLLRILPGR